MKFKVQYKIENKMTPTDISGVSLDGEIGARFDRFTHERTAGEFAIKEILDEALRAFSDQLDDEFYHGV